MLRRGAVDSMNFCSCCLVMLLLTHFTTFPLRLPSGALLAGHRPAREQGKKATTEKKFPRLRNTHKTGQPKKSPLSALSFRSRTTPNGSRHLPRSSHDIFRPRTAAKRAPFTENRARLLPANNNNDRHLHFFPFSCAEASAGWLLSPLVRCGGAGENSP